MIADLLAREVIAASGQAYKKLAAAQPDGRLESGWIGVAIALKTTHQPGPAAEGRVIHGEMNESAAYLIEPEFNCAALCRALLAGPFDRGLDFTDGQAGKEYEGIINAREVGERGPMGVRPAQFGVHVGLEPGGSVSAATGLRIPMFCSEASPAPTMPVRDSLASSIHPGRHRNKHC